VDRTFTLFMVAAAQALNKIPKIEKITPENKDNLVGCDKNIIKIKSRYKSLVLFLTINFIIYISPFCITWFVILTYNLFKFYF
jgi:hypothetical protein